MSWIYTLSSVVKKLVFTLNLLITIEAAELDKLLIFNLNDLFTGNFLLVCLYILVIIFFTLSLDRGGFQMISAKMNF